MNRVIFCILAAFFSACTMRQQAAIPQLAGTAWEKQMDNDCADAFSFKEDGTYDFFSCELMGAVQGTYLVEKDTLFLIEDPSDLDGHDTPGTSEKQVRFALVYSDSALRFVSRHEKENATWKNTGFSFADDYVFQRAPKRTAPAIRDAAATVDPHGAVSFRYENDTLKQTVLIDSLSPGMFRFSYFVIGAAKNEYRISGTAQLKQGDLEIDEDEEGNAVAVEEYVYEEGDGYLAFRIDADTRSRMSITAGDCPQPLCVVPAGILRRK